MTPIETYYIRIRSAVDHLEPVLLEIVAPLLDDFRSHPRLESAHFARHRADALLFVTAERELLDAEVRPRVERAAESCRGRGAVEGWLFPEYVPETQRYGGEEGVRLAGRIFEADSRACLHEIDADRRGGLRRSRREWSLALTERLLDLLRIEPSRRAAFYRYSYDWVVEQGLWERDDFELLERRYRGLKDGLAELLRACGRMDSDDAWGGGEPALAARRWIEDTGPLAAELLEAHAAGRVRQDLVPLAWSYAHMHCIRLGIEGNAEAILRFFMHRLYEDGFGSDA